MQRQMAHNQVSAVVRFIYPSIPGFQILRRQEHMAWFGRPSDEQQQTRSGVSPSETEALDAYSRSIIQVVGLVGPAVVQVGVQKAVNERTIYGVTPRLAEGAGSGVIFAPDGYI